MKPEDMNNKQFDKWCFDNYNRRIRREKWGGLSYLLSLENMKTSGEILDFHFEEIRPHEATVKIVLIPFKSNIIVNIGFTKPL